MKKTIKMNIPDFWGVGNQQSFKSTRLTPNEKSKSAITSIGQGQPLSSQKDSQFSWVKDKPNKKNMDYKQAHRFFSLSPVSDVDRDGIPNWRDCKPFDSTRQGKHFEAFKKTLKSVVPKTTAKKTDPQTTLDKYVEKQPEWHVFVKFPQAKWEKVGTTEQKNIKKFVNEYKQTFDNLEDIKISQDPKLHNKMNRGITYQKTKKAVTDYVERKGKEINENIQAQFQPPQQQQMPQQFQTQMPFQQVQPQQQAQNPQYQQLPPLQQQQSQYPQYQTEIPQQRKIPPGTQRYNPVTKAQTNISRPMLRSPFQSKPRTHKTMPPIKFKMVKF